jgi:hypothetical protein
MDHHFYTEYNSLRTQVSTVLYPLWVHGQVHVQYNLEEIALENDGLKFGPDDDGSMAKNHPSSSSLGPDEL